MVIIRVSSSSENAMLNTVSVLRRLLRNALLVTKPVKVMRFGNVHWLTLRLLRRFPARGKSPPMYALCEDNAALGIWTTAVDLREDHNSETARCNARAISAGSVSGAKRMGLPIRT